MYLGKKAPLSRARLTQWIYHRRGIPYYKAHIIDGGKIVNYEIVRQSEQFYKYKKKQYNLIGSNENEEKHKYTPSLQYGGDYLIFHNINHTAPLEFKQEDITPLWLDPNYIANMIANKDVSDGLAPDRSEELSGLARKIFILNSLALCVLAIVMWYFTQGG